MKPKPKLHRSLCAAVVRGLTDIFVEAKFADKVVSELLRSDERMGSRDRAFVASSVYEVLRNRRKLAFLAQIEGKDSAEPALWRMLGVYLLEENYILSPDWKEFESLQNFDLPAQLAQLSLQPLAVRESYPDWLFEKLAAAHGNTWPALAAALNKTAALCIRVNRLKTEVPDMISALKMWEPQPLAWSQDALLMTHRSNLFAIPEYKNGLIEVQDAGSQCISAYVGALPGMRVVDACAGAGGKTLHLAAIMQNRGSIIALDTEGWKLVELRRRAVRGGVQIAETRTIDSTKTVKRLFDSADRLLLDVPCSGTGVFRRNPDSKWKLSEERIAELIVIQAEILSYYSAIVKVGGVMVYATCSILPQENEMQVDSFLSANKEKFKLLNSQYILPTEFESDGFYMAKIERIA